MTETGLVDRVKNIRKYVMYFRIFSGRKQPRAGTPRSGGEGYDQVRKSLSFFDLDGWRSLRSALASI